MKIWDLNPEKPYSKIPSSVFLVFDDTDCVNHIDFISATSFWISLRNTIQFWDLSEEPNGPINTFSLSASGWKYFSISPNGLYRLSINFAQQADISFEDRIIKSVDNVYIAFFSPDNSEVKFITYDNQHLSCTLSGATVNDLEDITLADISTLDSGERKYSKFIAYPNQRLMAKSEKLAFMHQQSLKRMWEQCILEHPNDLTLFYENNFYYFFNDHYINKFDNRHVVLADGEHAAVYEEGVDTQANSIRITNYIKAEKANIYENPNASIDENLPTSFTMDCSFDDPRAVPKSLITSPDGKKFVITAIKTQMYLVDATEKITRANKNLVITFLKSIKNWFQSLFQQILKFFS